jgi:GNAT superfamily N-acetyltransferase
MPDLVRPNREELNMRKKLHKKEMITEEMLDAWYREYIENESDDAMYRLIWCGGCEDFVGECGWRKEADRYELLLYVLPSLRRCGYGTDSLVLVLQEAEKKGITHLYAHMPEDEESLFFLKHRGFEEKQDGLFTIETGRKPCTKQSCGCRRHDS